MAHANQFALLHQRRFAPFFWTQFAGAANDNIFKNALVIFVAYRAAMHTSLDANTLVNLAAGVFILPFMLLSATAGQLADKYEKSRFIRVVKVFEIAIMLVGAVGFYYADLVTLFVALFLMGVHSTLFGPVKYAILPQHLRTDELVGGNGLVEMGTFIAILLGTIAGGLLVAVPGVGPLLAGGVAIAVAVVGWLVSRGIPVTPAVAPDLAINWNPLTETWRSLRFAYGNRIVWLSMLGISWFWFYGATFLTQFPNFAKNVLGGDEHVVTFLLALFSIGIGVGSLLCERLAGRKVEIGLVPFGSIGLTVFAVDLWWVSADMQATSLVGIAGFLAGPGHVRVVIDLVLIGLFGGFFIVPLYALIQERADPAHRSRIIAANNILNAVFMVASAGLAIVLLGEGLSIPYLFLVTGILNAVVALFIYKLVPEFLLRFLAWLLIHTVYRVDERGLDNVPADGPCIIVCNHVSYVDALVISACVPRPIRFVMDHAIFRIPVLSTIFHGMRAIPVASGRVDPALKERAFAETAAALRAGEIVGIFPEGSLTRDGEMAAFRAGVERMVRETPVPVVPMALRGLWGSFFSRAADGRAMRRFRGVFTRIGIVAAAPVAPAEATPEALHALVLALRGDRR
ncbi:MAG: MFS transporter [Burkholderiales bacterium]|nr:MFS transporter [Burkholderiales bacterium]